MASYRPVPHEEKDDKHGSGDISISHHRNSNNAFSLSPSSPFKPLNPRLSSESGNVTIEDDIESSPIAAKHARNPGLTPSQQLPWHRKLRFATGWRRGIQFSVLLTFIVLLANIAALVIAIRFGEERQDGVSMIMEEKCTETKRQSLIMHLGINILSTMLLGASSYTMQILCSPTPKDVERAHKKSDWLDIGAPGWRNLRSRRIGKMRLTAFGLLFVSSLPLHLLYNSVVITTVASNYVAVVLVPEALLLDPTAPVELKKSIMRDSAKATAEEDKRIDKILDEVRSGDYDTYKWENITWDDCAKAYSQNFITDRHDVILVSNASISSSEKNIIHYGLQLPVSISDVDEPTPGGSYDWISPYEDSWVVEKQIVTSCLSESVSARCTVHLNFGLIIVIIACNVIKLVCMIWTQLSSTIEDPLVTLGDAVSWFLASPDESTKNMCAMTVMQEPKRPGPRVWDDKEYHWSAAVPKGFRVVFVLCVLLSLIPLISFACVYWGTSFSALWSLGFGSIHGEFLFSPEDSRLPSSLLGQVIMANAPQAIYSAFYFVYNFFLTRMVLAREWSFFAHQRKPLRVSRPIGSQRSTYFLQLPYRYSLPLMALSAMVHWMVSQSFFFVQVRTVVHEVPYDQLAFHTIGFSVIGMIFTIVLGAVMPLTLWIVGRMNRYKPGIPFARTCSMVIAAACHNPDGEKVRLGSLQWGVVPGTNEKGVGHCTFSDGPVGMPQEGEMYAGDGGEEDHRMKHVIRRWA